jgi:hypothetical protein
MFSDLKIATDENERDATVVPLLMSLDSPKLATESEAKVRKRTKERRKKP